MRVIQSGRVDVLELSSDGNEGVAAPVHSQRCAVELDRQYTVTMDLKTEGLQSIDTSMTRLRWPRGLRSGKLHKLSKRMK